MRSGVRAPERPSWPPGRRARPMRSWSRSTGSCWWAAATSIRRGTARSRTWSTTTASSQIATRSRSRCCTPPMRLHLPTLCICRGMQVMNVAFGGTLHQHLPSIDGLLEHGVPLAGTQTLHDVVADPGTLLWAAIKPGPLACSSHHHQGVDRVGEGLARRWPQPRWTRRGDRAPASCGCHDRRLRGEDHVDVGRAMAPGGDGSHRCRPAVALRGRDRPRRRARAPVESRHRRLDEARVAPTLPPSPGSPA